MRALADGPPGACTHSRSAEQLAPQKDMGHTREEHGNAASVPRKVMGFPGGCQAELAPSGMAGHMWLVGAVWWDLGQGAYSKHLADCYLWM